MKSVRLLPIVVMAASALLALKTIGIMTGGGYVLSGMNAALAMDAGAAPTPFEQLPSTSTDPIDVEVRGGEMVHEQASSTTDTLLQSLTNRRAELDALAAELEARAAVVEAAEVRIEERMAELSAMEARINATLNAQDSAEAEQFAAIVAMYEAMRPGDAAIIFNTLDVDVLTRVSRAMNPRKLGPILAEMVPQRAQDLTVRLAQGTAPAPQPVTVADPFSNLPQIVGQ